MERPRLRRSSPIRLGIAVSTSGDADQLRLSVAGQVRKRRRLVVRRTEHLVPPPVGPGAFRILEPRGGRAGKPDDEDVVPAVFVEVVGPGKKIVGVLVLLSECALKARHGDGRHRPELQLERRRGRIVLVALREVRALPPPWAGDDVLDAVVVQIAGVGPLAPELIAQLDAFECGGSAAGACPPYLAVKPSGTGERRRARTAAVMACLHRFTLC